MSFEEGPDQIIRNAQAFGWELEELIDRRHLEIFHVSPAELNIDRHAFDIQNRVAQLGAKLLVIDSITAFEVAVPTMAKYQNYLWAITDHCKRYGITNLLTTELADSVNPLQVSRQWISFVTDTIILLRYVESGGEIKRTLSVLKMRGSNHDKMVREVVFNPPEITIGTRLAQPGALLPNPTLNETEV